jgi:hypothetical protein
LFVTGGEVYVAGDRGAIFRRRSELWTEIQSRRDIKISGLAWYRDELYAAAGLNGTYKVGPHGIELAKHLVVYRMKTVGDRLFCFGNNLIAQYDGTEWWGGQLSL